MSQNTLKIQWTGEDGFHWTAVMGIKDASPCIVELGYERSGFYSTLAKDLIPQFKVITSERTRNNPQRTKGLAPGEILGYQWDTYSDDQ